MLITWNMPGAQGNRDNMQRYDAYIQKEITELEK